MISRNGSTPCDHCGLPIPSGLIASEQNEQFCCRGCEAAWQLIHANGLDAFYSMVDSSGEAQSLRDRSPDVGKFQHLDDSGFLEKFAKSFNHSPDLDSERQLEVSLALEGIHCAACVWLIEKLPDIVTGVVHARVNWSKGTVRLRWVEGSARLSQIAEALHRLGYYAVPLRTNDKSHRRQRENRRHLIRIGIAGAAAGNNMLIAAALYFGLFSYMDDAYGSLLRWSSCLIGLISLLGPGQVFLRGAWSALRTWTPHMDLPIALGLTVGGTAGLINTVRGTGEIYFDSLSVLIFLLLVGRWIQFRQQSRAADAVDLLYRLTPQRARKKIDGQWVEVVVDDIEQGDLLEIRPGDPIPADAVVIEGSSSVDESILTGESKPAEKVPGDPVAAGSTNLLSTLVVEVEVVGTQTRLGRILDLVEQASSDRPEIVQWANRIGGYFVVTVMILAIVTLALWLQINPRMAVDQAVALLIVACPCALALATPLAISVALGRLARQRIMVKSGDVLQALDRPGMIWLDKTGTLTEGRMRVTDWFGDRQWITGVAQIESHFSHPIAAALVEFAKAHSRPDESSPEQTVENLTARPNGVSAKFNGCDVLIGNRKFLISSDIHIDSEWARQESRILKNHFSPCWISVDRQVVAMASLGDRIRGDAQILISQLKHQGWDVGILSGDHPSIVESVASELGIEHIRAGVTPVEKVDTLRRSSGQYDTTVMVGDGVNDSAALAAATVGIAVHNGAEASLAAAPVYLAESGLSPIHQLLQACRSTCQTIRWNFGASLAYNGIGAGLAMAGWIHPLVAAVLMPISSLTVIAISLRAGHIDNRPIWHGDCDSSVEACE